MSSAAPACLRRGEAATDWVGVASGALGQATSWRDGRASTLELLGPGDWYGDIALIDGSTVDLGLVAQTHGTVLMVSQAGLQQLMQSQPDLLHALLQLDCRRLRHMFRRLEELQTLPLAQRVAIKLQRLLQSLGILGGSYGRIEVLQPLRLADVAQGRLALDGTSS